MKKIIISSIVVLLISISLLTNIKTKEEYKTINIDEIENNNLIGIYIKQDDKYIQSNNIPEGYVLDKKETYCTKPNDNTKIKDMIDYNPDNKTLNVSSLNDNNTKCYLYFNKVYTAEDTLASLEKATGEEFTKTEAPSSYSSTDEQDHGNTLYYTEDNDGISYFYRGAAKNNWVKFGTNDTGDKDVWWRIVRINGDGTIRLIYTGMYETRNTPQPEDKAYVTGTDTVVATNQPFSSSSLFNDNTYVGFYYGNTGGEYSSNHSNANISNIASELKKWYEGPNWKDTYNEYIDEDAGFCNDRTIHPLAKTWWNAEGDNERGTGYVVTMYGPGHRATTQTGSWSNSQTPTLICGKSPTGTGNEVSNEDYKRDLYTLKQEKRENKTEVTKGNGVLEVPVGLITADKLIQSITYTIIKTFGQCLHLFSMAVKPLFSEYFILAT